MEKSLRKYTINVDDASTLDSVGKLFGIKCGGEGGAFERKKIQFIIVGY